VLVPVRVWCGCWFECVGEWCESIFLAGDFLVHVFDCIRMLIQARQVSEEAAKLAAAALWPLADADVTDMLLVAHRLEQVAVVLKTRLAQQAEARGIPKSQGYRSLPGWLRSVLVLDAQPARQLTDQVAVVNRPALQQAILDGRMDLRQATAVAATCDAIPDDLSGLDEIGVSEAARIAEQAEATQIAMAERLSANQLHRVGERILAHVAPQIADRADELSLARQEARARARRGFTLSMPARGLVRVSGLLTAEDAATVQAALHPLCAPTPGDDRTLEQRRADALGDICRLALRTGDLPADGGEPPQLAVTVSFDALTHTLRDAVTETGERLSADTARRLACDARVLPLVLGTVGQILDAGRSRRLATGPLRRALAVRDRGCAFPDCDRPPRWTDAHHVASWTDGGPTDLGNLVLLCRRHHTLVHDRQAGWLVRLADDGLPDFVPPPTLDIQQRPRRNLFHLRQ
jgi:hypothetical protein